MKLLLHTCCAPCAIFPARKAVQDGFGSVAFYFYNPNIHPKREFDKRLEQVVKLNTGDNIVPEYVQSEYFSHINDFDDVKGRCRVCWRLRIAKTVEFARDNGYDAFTTTLLASPYQDHEHLKAICDNAAASTGVKFYYHDFREGFRDAHDQARANGVYCQNYCGCVFSMVEREEAKRDAKKKVKK